MKERPILFSGPMVRAILEGRKTVTRRIVNDRSRCGYAHSEIASIEPGGFTTVSGIEFSWDTPYGEPGDRLWVRETWCPLDGDYKPIGRNQHVTPGGIISWRADHLDPKGDAGPLEWRPSIFMPRWASRIALDVTGVRVERLHEISNQDAMREGIPQMYGEARIGGLIPEPTTMEQWETARDRWDNSTSAENFSRLWDRINGERAPWTSNPLVWVLDFNLYLAATRAA